MSCRSYGQWSCRWKAKVIATERLLRRSQKLSPKLFNLKQRGVAYRTTLKLLTVIFHNCICASFQLSLLAKWSTRKAKKQKFGGKFAINFSELHHSIETTIQPNRKTQKFQNFSCVPCIQASCGISWDTLLKHDNENLFAIELTKLGKYWFLPYKALKTP